MPYQTLIHLFQSAPALKLLTRKNAPLILTFLQESFKQDITRTRSNTELTGRLAGLLEDLAYNEEDEDLSNEKLFADYDTKAAQYIERWTNAGFLRKYPDEQGEDVHELTPDSEKVLLWIGSLERREFVGTDSRFKDIFIRLKDLITQTEEDPGKRLQELEEQKHEIEKKITAIKLRGRLSAEDLYDDTEIRERFYRLNTDARELLSDFTEVEQNFEDLRRDIQRRYLEHDTAKGDLLGFVLTALEDLSRQPQGKSFRSFWEFLRSEATKQEFDGLVAQLYGMLQARGIDATTDRFLKNLKRHLLQSGKKVVDANQKLSEKLSRILSERNLRERRRVLELIADIRTTALHLSDLPARDEIFLDIETVPALNLPGRWEISLAEKSHTAIQFPIEAEALALDAASLAALYSQFTIDREALKKRINALLQDRDQIGLDELVRFHGIKHGLGELIGYLSIALDDGHLVDEASSQAIKFGDRKITMPTIIFIRQTAAQLA